MISPVKRVSYRVEPTRVGQVTDYDKLLLQLTPNPCQEIDATFLDLSLTLFLHSSEPIYFRCVGA